MLKGEFLYDEKLEGKTRYAGQLSAPVEGLGKREKQNRSKEPYYYFYNFMNYLYRSKVSIPHHFRIQGSLTKLPIDVANYKSIRN